MRGDLAGGPVHEAGAREVRERGGHRPHGYQKRIQCRCRRLHLAPEEPEEIELSVSAAAEQHVFEGIQLSNKRLLLVPSTSIPEPAHEGSS